jgi:hypothetical protein
MCCQTIDITKLQVDIKVFSEKIYVRASNNRGAKTEAYIRGVTKSKLEIQRSDEKCQRHPCSRVGMKGLC